MAFTPEQEHQFTTAFREETNRRRVGLNPSKMDVLEEPEKLFRNEVIYNKNYVFGRKMFYRPDLEGCKDSYIGYSIRAPDRFSEGLLDWVHQDQEEGTFVAANDGCAVEITNDGAGSIIRASTFTEGTIKELTLCWSAFSGYNERFKITNPDVHGLRNNPVLVAQWGNAAEISASEDLQRVTATFNVKGADVVHFIELPVTNMLHSVVQAHRRMEILPDEMFWHAVGAYGPWDEAVKNVNWGEKLGARFGSRRLIDWDKLK